MRYLTGCILLLLQLSPLTAEELIVWGVTKDRGLDAALRQFEVEHPGWKVITSVGSSDGMDPQKLMCGIAGGSPPDVIRQDRFSVGEWAVRDAFLSLDDWIARGLTEEALAAEVDSLIRAGRTDAALEPLWKLLPALERGGPDRRLDLARALRSGIEEKSHPLAPLSAELRLLSQETWQEKNAAVIAAVLERIDRAMATSASTPSPWGCSTSAASTAANSACSWPPPP